MIKKQLNVKLKEVVNNKQLLKEGESIVKIYPNSMFDIGPQKQDVPFSIEVIEGILYRKTNTFGTLEYNSTVTYIGEDGESHTENIIYKKNYINVLAQSSLYSFSSNAVTFFTDDLPAIVKIYNKNNLDMFVKHTPESYIIRCADGVSLSDENFIRTHTYLYTIGSNIYNIQLDEEILLFNTSKYPTYPTIEVLDDKLFDNWVVDHDNLTLYYKILRTKNPTITNAPNFTSVLELNNYLETVGYRLLEEYDFTSGTSKITHNKIYSLRKLSDDSIETSNDIEEYYVNISTLDTTTNSWPYSNMYYHCKVNSTDSTYIRQKYYTSLPGSPDVVDGTNEHFVSTTTVNTNSYYEYLNMRSSNRLYLFTIDTKNKPIGYSKYLRILGYSTNPVITKNFDYEDENNGLDSEHLPNLRSISFCPSDKRVNIKYFGRLINNVCNFGFLVNSNIYGDVEDLITEFIKNGRTENFSIIANSSITYKGVPIGYAKTMRFLYNAETGTFEKEE